MCGHVLCSSSAQQHATTNRCSNMHSLTHCCCVGGDSFISMIFDFLIYHTIHYSSVYVRTYFRRDAPACQVPRLVSNHLTRFGRSRQHSCRMMVNHILGVRGSRDSAQSTGIIAEPRPKRSATVHDMHDHNRTKSRISSPNQ